VFLSKVSLDELELVEGWKVEEGVQIAVSSQLTDFKQHNIAKIKNGKLTQRQKNYTIWRSLQSVQFSSIIYN
jgi:hypothetical protein